MLGSQDFFLKGSWRWSILVKEFYLTDAQMIKLMYSISQSLSNFTLIDKTIKHFFRFQIKKWECLHQKYLIYESNKWKREFKSEKIKCQKEKSSDKKVLKNSYVLSWIAKLKMFVYRRKWKNVYFLLLKSEFIFALLYGRCVLNLLIHRLDY